MYRIVMINPLGEEELLNQKFSSEEDAWKYVESIEDPACDYSVFMRL